MNLRALTPADETDAVAFLGQSPDTTLFLRGNIARVGIVDGLEAHQGAYVAAFEDGRIVGVAAHYWNGNVILHAPREPERLVRAAVMASGREVRGLIGVHAEVVAARQALGWGEVPAWMDSHEILYALDLAQLAVPSALAEGRVTCRRSTHGDLDTLVEWREQYDQEALGVPADPERRAVLLDGLHRAIDRGDHWVAEEAGQLVAMTGFNSRVANCVQIGGVFTPPALRRRGYGRAAVAGSLLAERDQGVARSILFTGEENVGAQRAYEALGYQRTGDYHLVLFAEPARVSEPGLQH